MKALQGLFEELDVDKSGSVSVDELMEGLERLGYDISEAGACRAAHAALCVLCWVSGLGMLEGSGLGVLGYDVTEAGACRAALRVQCCAGRESTHTLTPPGPAPCSVCAEMEQLMNRVDVNHDGSLELAEFVAGLVDWSQLQVGVGGCERERRSVCARPGRPAAAAGGGGWVRGCHWGLGVGPSRSCRGVCLCGSGMGGWAGGCGRPTPTSTPLSSLPPSIAGGQAVGLLGAAGLPEAGL